MPAGTITDPKLNKEEKDYGILIDLSTGYQFYYLKDKNCQYLTHGTPVKFKLIKTSVPLQDKSFELDLAVNVTVDAKLMKDHPVFQQLNKTASAAVQKNSKHNRPTKSFKLS